MPLALIAALSIAAAGAGGRLAVPYTAEEAAVMFRIANEAFARDEVPTAIEGYERLLAAGYENEDVHYNLGTAQLRQGRLGPAILHLERALRFAPGDEDARANLERARKMRVDRLVGTPEEIGGDEPLSSRIATRTSATAFSWAFLVLYLGCAASLLVRRFATSPGRRALLMVVALVAGVGAAPAGAVVAAHAWVREATQEAVVTASVTPVKEGPSSDARTAFEVHEGLIVRVLGEDGDHVHIRLSNGLEGWAAKDAVTGI